MSTLTMVEIIDETVKFFGDDPTRRSKRDTKKGLAPYTCSYSGDNGNHCAVGRCLTQEALDKHPDRFSEADVRSVWSCIKALDRDLQPQYRGHSLTFWEKLQHLHDYDWFWDSDGISEAGRCESLSMQSKFMR